MKKKKRDFDGSTEVTFTGDLKALEDPEFVNAFSMMIKGAKKQVEDENKIRLKQELNLI